MSQVKLYVVLSPSANPEKIEIDSEIVALSWAFAKLDNEQMIDQIAEVDKQLKALDKWIEAARGVLKARLKEPEEAGQETVTRGVAYEAHYVKSSRTALDQAKVKEFLGDSYPKYCKTTPVLTLKITPISSTPGMVS